MSYIRDYKNLREALNCMAADGVDKQQAQLSICEALLAKTIKLRVSIDRSDPDLGGAVLADHNVQLPQHFSPADLDWAESRPWQQWSTGLSAWDWKLRSIEWIEICEADLIVLIHSIGPPPLRPTGGGYMPLTAAAHWIASVGGKLSIGADESYWRPAYEKLLSAIMKGAEIVGHRNETGIPERIPKETFVGLDIAYPCSDFATDLHLGGRAFIDCCLYIDAQFWCDHSDRLFTQGRSDIAAWSHLAVEMDAVARVCPAAITEPPAPPPGGEPQAARQPAAAKPAELGFPVEIAEYSRRRYLTGAPGRPTPMHLVEDELNRLIGSLKPDEFLGQSITEVAKLLATWWKENRHPEEAPLTDKAIMNSLRASIREHVPAPRARN